MVSAASYIIGALITTLAPNFVIMVIGRIVYGIGIGLVRYIYTFYEDSLYVNMKQNGVECI